MGLVIGRYSMKESFSLFGTPMTYDVKPIPPPRLTSLTKPWSLVRAAGMVESHGRKKNKK
jgi:hypothetical protein